MPGRQHRVAAGTALLGAVLCGDVAAAGEAGGHEFRDAFAGANIGRQPLELEHWPLIEQPAPADAEDGWRSLEVRLGQGLIDLYLNGGKLKERPLPVERVITDIVNVDAGYAGVYAGHLGTASPAEARIDGFVYRVP
jgi:hypothetical protein